MMKIATTGFVAANAGSVASANAVLLRGLLSKDYGIDFYTKPSFVDPRPSLNGCVGEEGLHVIDCTNHWGDGLRRKLTSSGDSLWGRMLGMIDTKTYHRGLVHAMQQSERADIDLWLGDWARGRGERPAVSFAQGPPGTDARSVFTRGEMIKRLAGKAVWSKLAVAAYWRLGLGLPCFRNSSDVIVGSEWSRQCLIQDYSQPDNRTHAIPYPIDLDAFSPSKSPRPTNEPLRVFWLGRFVPRKRLDVFLDGLALAIENGSDVEAWVVGCSGFVPGYEKLLSEFPFPKRLKHWNSVPREEISLMLAEVDVMAQPSDEENFGSSVAEALACGVPAIVGKTNGTGDYICQRSIRLTDDRPETFAKAIVQMADAKQAGELQDPLPSRRVAEQWFDPKVVVERLEEILHKASSHLRGH